MSVSPGLLPVPDLSDARVRRVVVGIRPCRRGGLRLEAGDELGAGLALVHNYGHGGCGVTLGPGTAEPAADLVREHAGADAPALVLGGGVVGMTTAHELATRGHRVTLAAAMFATQTTSNVAGAVWLPTGLDFPEVGASRDRLNKMLRRAHAKLDALREPSTPTGLGRWGVEHLPVYEPHFAEQHAEYYEAGAIEPPVAIESIPLPGVPLRGWRFETLFVHTPRFLSALRAELDRLGVDFITTTLGDVDSVRSLASEVGARAVVNCLAFGSRAIFGDDAIYPARGHLVHLDPQPLGYIMHNEYRYMFPREDALVLGGSFEPDSTDTTPDEATVADILAYHRGFFAGRS